MKTETLQKIATITVFTALFIGIVIFSFLQCGLGDHA